MKTDGKLVIVGAPNEMKYAPFKLIFGRKSIHGSDIASNTEVRKMLEFCAKHNIVVCRSPSLSSHLTSLTIHQLLLNRPKPKSVI
jgi:D-arabinose 1-dehydrogenase-like Zn-dependent alcohol dehydrogenase